METRLSMFKGSLAPLGSLCGSPSSFSPSLPPLLPPSLSPCLSHYLSSFLPPLNSCQLEETMFPDTSSSWNIQIQSQETGRLDTIQMLSPLRAQGWVPWRRVPGRNAMSIIFSFSFRKFAWRMSLNTKLNLAAVFDMRTNETVQKAQDFPKIKMLNKSS